MCVARAAFESCLWGEVCMSVRCVICVACVGVLYVVSQCIVYQFMCNMNVENMCSGHD